MSCEPLPNDAREAVDAGAEAAVDAVLQRHGARPEALLQILREVQVHTRWLPREVLARVARAVGLSSAVVEGVAGFYRFLHLRPVGPHHLLWSDNITDRMLGSRTLAQDLARRLHAPAGGPAVASWGFTSDLGLADQGPSVLVDQQHVLTRMDAARVARLAELLHDGVPVEAWPAEWRRVDDQVRRPDVLLAAPAARGDALRVALVRGPDAVVAELEASGLRGRGGAGFPTAAKWQACRHAVVAPGATRVVVCNADEGECGTFKDRVLLARQADAVVEGMTVAARCLDARLGFIYLRGEYRWLLPALEAVLARRRDAGLLGRAILGTPGFDFDVAIHLGAGAYVCGEETALLDSLEGKRGTPRIRPPFPVERGYLGQPTVVNNVETFCAVTRIVERGGARWARIGCTGSTGTKLHSVSGDCERPGVYEYPFGIGVAEILADCGARRTQAVQVGGASGMCLAPHEFERRIAFEDVPSAGAFMVFDEWRDMFEVAQSFIEFFAHESCGFCTPCRVGTELIRRRMRKLAEGHGSIFDEPELRELEALLRGTTHCGLGGTATVALRDVLARFRPAFERRLREPRFVPAFDLDAELAAARAATGRDDAHAHLERRG